MKNEEYYKFFLYQLLHIAFMEARFKALSDKSNKKDIYIITNFLHNLPLQLLNILEEENDIKYETIVSEYEKHSQQIGLGKWFNHFKEEAYELFLLQRREKNV